MRSVVVDGTDDHASSPRRYASERGPFEIAVVIPRFQIFHFAGAASSNPLRKMVEFGNAGGGSNACYVKAGPLGRLLDNSFHFADLICQRSPRSRRWRMGRTC